MELNPSRPIVGFHLPVSFLALHAVQRPRVIPTGLPCPCQKHSRPRQKPLQMVFLRTTEARLGMGF